MARSCSSLVWREMGAEGHSPVAVVVGETLAIAMVMISHRRMNSLLCLYL